MREAETGSRFGPDRSSRGQRLAGALRLPVGGQHAAQALAGLSQQVAVALLVSDHECIGPEPGSLLLCAARVRCAARRGGDDHPFHR